MLKPSNAAMTQQTSSRTAERTHRASQKPGVHLLSPQPEEAVDGTAVTLEWEPVEAATGYEIQISEEGKGGDGYFEAFVGPSTHFTIYRNFPTDGSRFFWRTRALLDDDRRVTSETRSFVTVTDDEALQAKAEREKADQATKREYEAQAAIASAQKAESEAPHLTGSTSQTEIVFYLILVFGAALIMWAIALIGVG